MNLIDKEDNFEFIRDKIALILANETLNQKALATAAGKDPALWDMRVYTEQSNPWEFALNDESLTPVVNVWFDRSNFDKHSSNGIERQNSACTFNIDVFGIGVSADVDGGGHELGNVKATTEVHRAIKLVRNILMASENTYLQERTIVTGRWISGTSVFQPPSDSKSAQNIMGGRIVLDVDLIEVSPQYEPVTLEYIAVDLKRAEDGSILAEADYDYTI